MRQTKRAADQNALPRRGVALTICELGNGALCAPFQGSRADAKQMRGKRSSAVSTARDGGRRGTSLTEGLLCLRDPVLYNPLASLSEGGAPKGRKESPRRRKAHMRAIALRQPLRFLRLLFSRGSARARSGNGAYNAPFPSLKAVKATPWLCQESAFSPFSHKSFASHDLCGSPI